jgi:hypothetical protein
MERDTGKLLVHDPIFEYSLFITNFFFTDHQIELTMIFVGILS